MYEDLIYHRRADRVDIQEEPPPVFSLRHQLEECERTLHWVMFVATCGWGAFLAMIIHSIAKH